MTGVIYSFGWNLIGNGTDNSSAADSPNLTGNIVNAGANLAPLGNYGGATETHALPPSSRALNAADPGGSFAFDQRGALRPARRSASRFTRSV